MIVSSGGKKPILMITASWKENIQTFFIYLYTRRYYYLRVKEYTATEN